MSAWLFFADNLYQWISISELFPVVFLSLWMQNQH